LDKIKVLLVDENPIVRHELLTLINQKEDIEIIDEASSGDEALIKAQLTRPDIILMDILMPQMSGLEATKNIIKKIPNIKILLSTVNFNEEYIIESYKTGARGLIIKDGPVNEIFEAIYAINNGERYFRPTVLRFLKEKQDASII
jgi:DNA-binding NarL/FixJ family response regulator